jgi:uncharacterized protein (DUF433 family)
VVDWSNCPDAESIPGKVSGAWCVKGTCVTVQGILDNARDFTAEQIATEIYEGVPVDVVLRILAYAKS